MPRQQSSRLGKKDYPVLPLPGPALVIDVRSSPGTYEDLRLLRYLLTELEDLTREMRLKQVHQWRHLAECFDFLQLEPLVSDTVLNSSTGSVKAWTQLLDPYDGFAIRMCNGD